ncbi:MAG: hypothetical protein ACI9QC_000703, partial [Oceanicoccus sp.]
RVYMKVTMPRQESQKDKQDATDKDFKERISIMEQLYRGLHEIRELNLSNRFFVWLTQRDQISFEIFAQYKKVSFYCSIHPFYAEILEKQVTSYYPDADIEYVKPPALQPEAKEGEPKKKKNFVKSYYMYLKKINWYPIKTYKLIENDPINDYTNVLSKLQKDEFAVIQLTMRPRKANWNKEAKEFGTAIFKGKDPTKGKGIFGGILRSIGWVFIAIFQGVEAADTGMPPPGSDSGDSYVRMLQTEEEVAKRIGEKANDVAFQTSIRIFASSSKGEAKCDEILNGILVAFNATKDAASNWLQSRRLLPLDRINSGIQQWARKNALLEFHEKTSLLTPQELSTLFHFPTSRYNYTPVIDWMSYKVLPLPGEAYTDGIHLGDNVYRGMITPVHFARKDRRRHHYIIGQTGTGKSAYVSWMARQDIWRGDGVCVIDPHGDLIEDILQYIPKERAKDVIVFDPADMERPMGLNMLEAKTTEQQDMASSQATEIFIKIFGDEIFGPRIQHYFRNACLTLMEDPDEGATLLDVPRIFVDDEFRKYKVSKVKNPIVKSFWDNEYANTGERERQEMIPYFSSKFGPFITNAIMRNTIGQSKSAFNVRDAMDNQKILLVNLSKGKLGTLNTQLLGLVLVAQIQMAAMSRVDTPEDERKDFYLYVDEFQNFATDTFCSILSEARKYRLSLIMAHQYIGQLVVNGETKIKDAVFGNVGTLQSFKVGAEDAEYLAKEYAPVLTEQDIIGISNYKAYLKLNIKNSTSRPFSLHTIWDTSKANKKVREIVKKYSRMKYGRKRLFVEQEIAARIGIDLEELGGDVDADYTTKVDKKGEPADAEHKEMKAPIVERPAKAATKPVPKPSPKPTPKDNGTT